MEERTLSSDIEFSVSVLTDKDKLSNFSCGCENLDDFFQKDILICAKNNYVSAYCAKYNNEILALFTLAHDVISLDNEEDRDDFIEESESKREKTYNDIFKKQILFPAINITYFGVSKKYQCKKIGADILDYIVHTFTNYKMAGCQFITVDSLNNPKTNAFYLSHGFYNLISKDNVRDTRRMYLPLQLYKNEI